MVVAALLGSCASYDGNADRLYYDSCYDETFCAAALECLPPPGGVCSARCVATVDCMMRFGDLSYCSITGWCLSSCTTIDDCPPNAERCEEGVCVPPVLGL